MLFEMLSGRRPFDGEDMTEVLGAVVRLEPQWESLPSTVPARVTQVLRLCLRKDPKQRVGDIRDVRLALEGEFETPNPQSGAAGQPQSPATRWLAAVGLALLAAALTGLGVWALLRPPAPHVTRLSVVVPDPAGLFENRSAMAISPDGRDLVYATNDGGLYHRPLGQRDARLVTEDASTPFFSPDGQWLGFYVERDRTLRKMSLAPGSAAVTLGELQGPPGAVSWGADDSILIVAERSRLVRLPGGGGTAEALIELADGEVARAPALLPDGGTVIVTLGRDGTSSIVAQSVASGARAGALMSGPSWAPRERRGYGAWFKPRKSSRP